MNAICLILDRLQAGYLGAYGNSWIETPAFDRLASESFLFDQALIDSPDLESIYRSYWQQWHALAGRPPEGRPSLAALLRDAGVNTALLTDERLVAEHSLAVDFDEVVEMDPPWSPQTAADIEQTHLAKCFVQIIDWLTSVRPPFFLWCHLGGLGTAWDAPREFRRRYREPGDPEPPAMAEVPERLFPDDPDPDEVLGIGQAYAGQVSLLDVCLAAFLELLDSSPIGRDTLLVVGSARGFPLGEHRRLGPCDEALYGELVHVPLLFRFPDRLGAAGRSQALVEPADLGATLLDYYDIQERPAWPAAESLMRLIREEARTTRDRLCIMGCEVERAIRTPAWYLRAAETPELFAKPDDRWEVNNVAVRCREVVECLQDALVQYEQTIRSGSIADLPPLSEVLISGMS